MQPSLTGDNLWRHGDRPRAPRTQSPKNTKGQNGRWFAPGAQVFPRATIRWYRIGPARGAVLCQPAALLSTGPSPGHPNTFLQSRSEGNVSPLRRSEAGFLYDRGEPVFGPDRSSPAADIWNHSTPQPGAR